MSEDEVKYTENEFIEKFQNEEGYWTKALPDDLASDKTIGKYINGKFLEVPKALVEINKGFGNKIPKPNPDGNWTKTDWDKYNQEWNPGYPESAEGYDVQVEMPEHFVNFHGQETLDRAFKEAQERAFKNGLTKSQFEYLWKEGIEKDVQLYESQQEFLEKTKNDQVAALKKKYGESYDDNMRLMQATLGKFFSADDIKRMELETAPPSTIDGIIRIAQHFKEGGIEPAEPQGGPSRAQLLQEKAELIKKTPDSPYWNKYDPRHASVKERVLEIHQALIDLDKK